MSVASNENTRRASFLPKFFRTRLLSKQKRMTDTRSQKKRRWRLLQVESSLACNLQCVMCPWRGTHQTMAGNGLMSQEVWEAIRPHLSQILSVDFSGGGEPLLQPRLQEWIGDAKGAGCETGFLTNGLLMKEEIAERMIHEGLDWIGFSMDGATSEVYEEIRTGSDFQRVCENLTNVAKLRTGKVPKTMINFVLMNTNFHQVEEIVRLAARLGVDQVNFNQCDVIRGAGGQRIRPLCQRGNEGSAPASKGPGQGTPSCEKTGHTNHGLLIHPGGAPGL